MPKPFRYSDLFKEKGVFKFTIQVTAMETEPDTIKLIFEWNGIWDNFEIFAER